MNELSTIIRSEIGRLGSIRFDRFMDLALYHPIHGYYRREGENPRTGREGDFFTSVSVGPLFGRLLARQFLEMWEKLERPAEFWIIEQGGEDAQLACDILAWCRDSAPAFFAAVHYILIEDGLDLREQQWSKTENEGLAKKVSWLSSVAAAAERKPAGVFFSNEFFDALPVRLVRRKDNSWTELHAALFRGDGFALVEKKIDDGRLSEAVDELELPTAEGYTTEINLRARDWMESAGRILQRGYVVTIDYGFPASIYYAPFRASGTLTSYRDHRQTEDVLRDPGSQDITAHVDFTALARAGEKVGLTTFGFLDQQRFLTGIAHEELSEGPGPRAGIAENSRAWQTLTNPGFLGTRFQVLLQARNAPPELAGLRFANGAKV